MNYEENTTIRLKTLYLSSIFAVKSIKSITFMEENLTKNTNLKKNNVQFPYKKVKCACGYEKNCWAEDELELEFRDFLQAAALCQNVTEVIIYALSAERIHYVFTSLSTAMTMAAGKEGSLSIREN